MYGYRWSSQIRFSHCNSNRILGESKQHPSVPFPCSHYSYFNLNRDLFKTLTNTSWSGIYIASIPGHSHEATETCFAQKNYLQLGKVIIKICILDSFRFYVNHHERPPKTQVCPLADICMFVLMFSITRMTIVLSL